MEILPNKYFKWASNMIILISIYNVANLIYLIPTNLSAIYIVTVSLITALLITFSWFIRKGYSWTKYLLIFFVAFSLWSDIEKINSIIFGQSINISIVLKLANIVTSYLALVFLSKAFNYEGNLENSPPKISKWIALLVIAICALVPILFIKPHKAAEIMTLSNIQAPVYSAVIIIFFFFVDYLFSEIRIYNTVLLSVLNLLIGFIIYK